MGRMSAYLSLTSGKGELGSRCRPHAIARQNCVGGDQLRNVTIAKILQTAKNLNCAENVRESDYFYVDWPLSIGSSRMSGSQPITRQI